MNKYLDFTSKKEYIAPMIYIEELEKHDVLTDSDNGEADANGFHFDLFSSMFSD